MNSRQKRTRRERLAEALLGAMGYADARGLERPPETNHSWTMADYCVRMIADEKVGDKESFWRLHSELRRSPMSLKGARRIATVVEVMSA